MRKPNTRGRNDQRICQIGDYWLSKKPGRDGANDAWCRTWYDARTEQTRRVSLGTSDLPAASHALAQWVVANAGRLNADPRDVLIDEVLLRYWEKHAQNLPSAATIKRNLSLWQEYWEGRHVAAITPDEQEAFRNWLLVNAPEGLTDSGIDRILSDGRAALGRARKHQELATIPHIFLLQDAEDRRNRQPMGRPLDLAEVARLFDAAASRHMLMFLLIGCCTLARPEATLELGEQQVDIATGILDLNPPGRRQTKKYRPIVPIAQALRPWLINTAGPTGHYVTYRGKPISAIWVGFRATRDRAGLDDRVTPYSLRHTMARELRRRKVPGDQISLFLGHLPKGSDATTAIYAPYDPDYLADAATAIDAIMQDIGQHLTATRLARPGADAQDAGDAAALPAIDMTGRASRRGVGEAKRDEVRCLILAGVPHRSIVERTGVSSGTVTGIRKALRASGARLLKADPLSVRAASVPQTAEARAEPPPHLPQTLEKNGGPARTRTGNQTVMSGDKPAEHPRKTEKLLPKP